MALHPNSDATGLHESANNQHAHSATLGNVSLEDIREINRSTASALPASFGNTFSLHSGENGRDNVAPTVMASSASDEQASMKDPSEVSVIVPEGMHGEISGSGCAVKVEPVGRDGKDSKITVTPVNGTKGCTIHQYPAGL